MFKFLYPFVTFYHLFRKHILKKDVQMLISPISLMHIERYRLAGKFIPPGSKVLDAACGSGYGSTYFNQCDYTGVDLDGPILGYARANYRGHFMECDVAQIQQLGTFDAIVSFETLEHVDAPDVALQGFVNALNPEGTLILSFPLNHPDKIYHKTVFTYGSVMTLLRTTLVDKKYQLNQFIQCGIFLDAVTAGGLSNEDDGTLTVVITGIA